MRSAASVAGASGNGARVRTIPTSPMIASTINNGIVAVRLALKSIVSNLTSPMTSARGGNETQGKSDVRVSRPAAASGRGPWART